MQPEIGIVKNNSEKTTHPCPSPATTSARTLPPFKRLPEQTSSEEPIVELLVDQNSDTTPVVWHTKDPVGDINLASHPNPMVRAKGGLLIYGMKGPWEMRAAWGECPRTFAILFPDGDFCPLFKDGKPAEKVLYTELPGLTDPCSPDEWGELYGSDGRGPSQTSKIGGYPTWNQWPGMDEGDVFVGQLTDTCQTVFGEAHEARGDVAWQADAGCAFVWCSSDLKSVYAEMQSC